MLLIRAAPNGLGWPFFLFCLPCENTGQGRTAARYGAKGLDRNPLRLYLTWRIGQTMLKGHLSPENGLLGPPSFLSSLVMRYNMVSYCVKILESTENAWY